MQPADYQVDRPGLIFLILVKNQGVLTSRFHILCFWPPPKRIPFDTNDYLVVIRSIWVHVQLNTETISIFTGLTEWSFQDLQCRTASIIWLLTLKKQYQSPTLGMLILGTSLHTEVRAAAVKIIVICYLIWLVCICKDGYFFTQWYAFQFLTFKRNIKLSYILIAKEVQNVFD